MTVIDSWDQSHSYPWEAPKPAVWPPLSGQELSAQTHDPDAAPIPDGDAAAEEPVSAEIVDDPDAGEATEQPDEEEVAG